VVQWGLVRRAVLGPGGLAVAFLAVHIGLAVLAYVDPTLQALGDINGVYRFWMDYWREKGVLVGIDTVWVYPVGALLPMMAATAFGDPSYAQTWVAVVTVLDGGALLLLARRSVPSGWWWVGATACLGPVALYRIDAVALPFAVAGVVCVARRPVVASVAFTVAAWIKVWPAALVAALLAVGRRRLPVLAAAAATSGGVIAVAAALGGGATVLSFVDGQAGRGLQIEAPVATPWVWLAAARVPGVTVYFDRTILTWQVHGPGVVATASWMNLVLAVGVVLVLGLGLLARRRGGAEPVVLALTAFGLVAALLALNKVGSPQYVTWYLAPVLLGLLADARRFLLPAVVVPVLAGLTQLVYPWFYFPFVRGDLVLLLVLGVRNLLELVLLGWAVLQLARPALLRRVPSASARVRAADLDPAPAP
jgi:hypothetical protein